MPTSPDVVARCDVDVSWGAMPRPKCRFEAVRHDVFGRANLPHLR